MKLLEIFKKKEKVQEETLAESQLAITVVDEEIKEKEESQDEREEQTKTSDKETHVESEDERIKRNLSVLLGEDEETLKREFIVGNVVKFLRYVGKAIVRSELTEKSVAGEFVKSKNGALGGMMVSPMFLDALSKSAKKNERGQLSLGTIIDFPFGEGTVNGKKECAKKAAKAKMDFAVVTIPNMLTAKDNEKELKQHVKKACRPFRKKKGVAINASDLSIAEAKRITKVLSKTKIQIITLLFGDSPMSEVKEKVLAVATELGGKELYAVVNVATPSAVTELFKIGVSVVYTPFADEITNEVIEIFGLKDVKLI